MTMNHNATIWTKGRFNITLVGSQWWLQIFSPLLLIFVRLPDWPWWFLKSLDLPVRSWLPCPRQDGFPNCCNNLPKHPFPNKVYYGCHSQNWHCWYWRQRTFQIPVIIYWAPPFTPDWKNTSYWVSRCSIIWILSTHLPIYVCCIKTVKAPSTLYFNPCRRLAEK